ncbi:MAG: sulfotransferase domain-containing protein [Bacteroidia bacterium]
MKKKLHPRPVDIMIAGAQKAATSSLQRYMGEHPDVITHFAHEFTYFFLEEEWKQGYDKRYEYQFGEIDNSKHVLAKNAGIMYWEPALQHLKEHNPEVKIIIVLRNPVDRAYSAFWFARWRGHEPLESFEEAIRSNPNRMHSFISRSIVDYIGRGEYARQIENVYRYFDKSQVLILMEDEMKSDLKRVIKRAFYFSGLDSSFVPDIEKKYNESSRSVIPKISQWMRDDNSSFKGLLKSLLSPKLLIRAKYKVENLNTTGFIPPPMNPETRKYLIDLYKPLNERLEKLLDLDFSSWNK